MIVLPILGNEAGYYLAEKKNASLVLFLTVPYTSPEYSWAVGEPFNPAYMPHPLLGYGQEMTFSQRALNTGIQVVYQLFRRLYVHPQIYPMMEEIFPGQELSGIDDLLNTAGQI